MEVHIGSLIKARAKELRIGPTELGMKIDTSKQNVYGIFKRKSVDTLLLTQISEALGFDFFRYYSNNLSGKVAHDHEAGPQSTELNFESLRAELETVRRENDYLKKINSLLDEKLSRLTTA